MGTSLLTPPESSEDEDNLSSCENSSSSLNSSTSSHRSFSSKSRSQSCLAQWANERLNKDVKSLLRTTHKNLTIADRAKFKLSVRLKKIKNVPFPRRQKKKKKKTPPPPGKKKKKKKKKK